jgi:transcriptional regulator of heat shock response
MTDALSERKKLILRVIVEDYINYGRPISSKIAAESPLLDVSSATIRNEMLELTKLGYLEQPHTSAGRIPSPLAYRLYLNDLMLEQRLNVQETANINQALRERLLQLDTMIAELSRMIGEISNHPVYSLLRSRAVLSGASALLDRQGYDDVEKARQLLAYIDGSEALPLPEPEKVSLIPDDLGDS